MSFWETRYIKKTRKKHLCVYCEQFIQPGQSCEQNVGIYEREFQNWYLCDMCSTLYQELGLDWSEGIGNLWEDSQSWIQDNVRECPHCKEAHEYEFDLEGETVKFECRACEHTWEKDLFDIVGIKKE